MRHLYSLLFYLSLPFILLRLLWRARKNTAYAKRWSERFGHLPFTPEKQGIWIHAVSVGETLAAIPLIKAFRKKHPHIAIFITTTTPTGSERVTTLLGKEVAHSYAPYDLPILLQHFLQQLEPRLLIIMETELWPNLLHSCVQKKIPVLLFNARLSARSAKGYQYFHQLTREMLKNISFAAVQYETDAQRFIALGLDPKKITVTGNIKFDLEIPTDLILKAKQLRKKWSAEERLIWIAASTHAGEEAMILHSFAEIRKTFPQLLLIFVPRHPERFSSVINSCREKNYRIVLRTEQQYVTSSIDIFIGNTMGELLLFYAMADCAFVGGSFVNNGGHNPLEPAAFGLPICMGPHVFNFSKICEQLQTAGILFTIHNATELTQKTLELLHDKNKRDEINHQARVFMEKNKGTLDKQLSLLEKYF